MFDDTFTDKKAAALAANKKLKQIGWLLLWFVLGFAASFGLTVGLIKLINLFAQEILRSGWWHGLLTNPVFLTFFISMVLYLLAIAIIVILPSKLAWLKKHFSFLVAKFREHGWTGWLKWKELAFGLASVVIYYGLTVLVLSMLVSSGWGGLDQEQALAFSKYDLANRAYWFLALVTFVLITPVVEEILFRGYLYHKLRNYNLFPRQKTKRRQISFSSKLLAAVVTSLLFGLAHGQLNVGIDTFILSMVACWTVEMTGSINSAIVLHMIKNAVAFYALLNF